MPERIRTSSGDGKIEALDETPFPTEDALHALIAEHPELLDGEPIRPAAPPEVSLTAPRGILQTAPSESGVQGRLLEADPDETGSRCASLARDARPTLPPQR